MSRMRSWGKSLVETCQINNSSCSTSKFWGCSSLVSFDVAEHRKLPPLLFSLPQCCDPVPRLTLIHPRLVKPLTLLSGLIISGQLCSFFISLLHTADNFALGQRGLRPFPAIHLPTSLSFCTAWGEDVSVSLCCSLAAAELLENGCTWIGGGICWLTQREDLLVINLRPNANPLGYWKTWSNLQGRERVPLLPALDAVPPRGSEGGLFFMSLEFV